MKRAISRLVLCVALLPALAACLLHPAPQPTPAAPVAVYLEIYAEDSAAKVPGARVEVEVGAAREPYTADGQGNLTLWLPVGMVAPGGGTHLYVTADGFLSYAQHLDVIPSAPPTQIFLTPVAPPPPALPPAHKGWPADRATWTRVRGDICGLRLPALKPYNTTGNDIFNSWMLPVYPPKIREEIYAHYPYSHIAVDPRPKYRDWYPSARPQTPAEFKALVYELLDRKPQLLPIAFLLDDSQPKTEAGWQRIVGPYLADPELRNLLKLVSVGWELDTWMTPAEAERAIRWLRARLAPDALLFVHMGPGHNALCEGKECEPKFWKRMHDEKLVQGILYQVDPAFSREKFVEELKNMADRVVLGKHLGGGWPDKGAFHLIAFEYSAYLETFGKMSLAEAKARGDLALTVPGVSGYGDGGTVR